MTTLEFPYIEDKFAEFKISNIETVLYYKVELTIEEVVSRTYRRENGEWFYWMNDCWVLMENNMVNPSKEEMEAMFIEAVIQNKPVGFIFKG